jgi:hypothetical protein
VPALLFVALILAPVAGLVSWTMVFADRIVVTPLGVILSLFLIAFTAFMLSSWIGAIVRPARLTTDEAGITLRTWLRTRTWRWSDVSNFRYVPSGLHSPARIEFDARRSAGGEIKLAVLPAMWRVPGETVVRRLQNEQTHRTRPLTTEPNLWPATIRAIRRT